MLAADSSTLSLLAAAALAAILIVTAAALVAWRGWLRLRTLEITTQVDARQGRGADTTTSRIEIADLKERIRRLEAIAAGVDL